MNTTDQLKDLQTYVERIDDELRKVLKKIEARPSDTASVAIFSMLQGIDKRMDSWPERILVVEQKADEAMKRADMVAARLAPLEDKMSGLVDSVGMLLERQEGIERGIRQLLNDRPSSF